MLHLLPVLYWRRCVWCGREFFARTEHTLSCSQRCNVRRWRAIATLAGTHGYVAGRFKRIA